MRYQVSCLKESNNMQLDAFVRNMTPAIHQSLKTALELGKWPDGRLLTEQEREASLQAVIVYEYENVPESERVGFMPAKCQSKAEEDTAETTILRFKE